MNSTEFLNTTDVIWDSKLSDIFAPKVLVYFFVAFSGVLYFWLTNWKVDADVFSRTVLCIQDTMSDWILIGVWYKTANYWWATLLLSSIFCGGYYTARKLQKLSSDESRFREMINFLIDFNGFAALRIARKHYLLRISLPNPKSVRYGQINTVLSKVRWLSHPAHADQKELSERPGDNEELKLVVAIENRRDEGGMLESAISLTLVSHYLIIGNVTYQPDVTQPS
jgi:hypothetical protein